MTLLGCIADDFTGATDLANTLVRGGMRTIQLIGTPEAGVPDVDADALVIALKSRTVPAAEAVRLSLAALRWLRGLGPRQYFFKYCSTFDSTDVGNIGPVGDALLQELGEPFTIVCPAFPENERTVYLGYLFVGGQLLSESPMRHHPLTPMTDANLVRVLGRQTSGRVELVPYPTVRRGPEAVREARSRLRAGGARYAVVDALDDQHLRDIGTASRNLPLITGGSGVARSLPENFRRIGLLGNLEAAATLPPVGGHAAVLAGSCSAPTLIQVAEMKRHRPSFFIDPMALAAGRDGVEDALRWARPQLHEGPVLIYSSAPGEDVARTQAVLGREYAGTLIERAIASIASALVAAGVRRMVVAGGETAGAVVQALGIRSLRIGPQIEPGVPWTLSLDDPQVAVALKSGNFGSRGFFLKALEMMQ